MEAIRVAIQQVNSIEEMEQLQAMLKSGIIPSKYQLNKQQEQQQNNGKFYYSKMNDFNFFT